MNIKLYKINTKQTLFAKKCLKGFTLIELMVSIALFSIVMVIASGAYITLLSASRSEQLSTSAINNISEATDSMVRDIRTGSCGSGQCVSGTSHSFTFTNSDGCTVTYKSDTSTGKKIERTSSCDETNAITDSTAVSISDLTFKTFLQKTTNAITGTSAEQVWVTILVTGKTPLGASKVQRVFHIETGATMRGIHIL